MGSAWSCWRSARSRKDRPRPEPCGGGRDEPRSSLHPDSKSIELAREVRHVVERLARDGFGKSAGLGCVAAEDDYPCVVVLHRQATVVLGSPHLTNVFPRLHHALGNVPGPREAARVELLRVSGIEEYCGPVVLEHILHAIELDLGEPDEGPPHRDAELIAAHVR